MRISRRCKSPRTGKIVKILRSLRLTILSPSSGGLKLPQVAAHLVPLAKFLLDLLLRVLRPLKRGHLSPRRPRLSNQVTRWASTRAIEPHPNFGHASVGDHEFDRNCYTAHHLAKVKAKTHTLTHSLPYPLFRRLHSHTLQKFCRFHTLTLHTSHEILKSQCGHNLSLPPPTPSPSSPHAANNLFPPIRGPSPTPPPPASFAAFFIKSTGMRQQI
ncbi:SURP and G-patch domain-containing protein 1 [Striga asiatica]|uniref:SURP and G-patch domain-containing protein 1 n=1 Tax=Striga asiatica TaxID=4170 RepID=A0A5A7PCG7_STRAF|nr:SURP and G-patch domain-containing protein 1 [Striga asiatica]